MERQVRRAKLAMVWWRFCTDLVEFPRDLFFSMAALFGKISKTLAYLELDAARRYKALTGADLASAIGEHARYAGLDPDRAERAQAELFDEVEDDE